jgi:capsular exopolysaccharide synthesis family protein
MAKRRWLLISVVALVATGYTINSVRNEKIQYQSKATVRLVDPSRAIAGDVASPVAVQMPFSSSANPIASQQQILLSEAVATTAVDLKGLRLRPADGSKYPAEIAYAAVSDSSPARTVTLNFGPTSFTMSTGAKSVVAPYAGQADLDGVRIIVQSKPSIAATTLNVVSKEQASGDILSRFRVTNRPETDILDLWYTDTNPEQATRVTNAMAEAYQVYNTNTARQFAARRRAFLEGQIRQIDAQLAAANTKLAISSAGRQNAEAVTAAQSATLTTIEGQRLDLESQKRSVQAVLDRIRRPGLTNSEIAQLISASPASLNGTIQGLAGQIAGIETQRDNLIAAGTAKTNPDIVSMEQQIYVLVTKMVSAAETQLQSIDARIDALKKAQVATGSAGASPAEALRATQDAQVAQDVQGAQRLSGELKSELQKARMAEAVEAGNVEIVQLRKYPGSPIPSGAPRKVLLGLLVGMMFGFGAAVLFESLDRSIRKRGEIEPMLGIPGLVVIPQLPSAASAHRALLPAFAKRADRRALEAKMRGDVDLVTVTDPRSPSAEAFRTLRTNLMFSQAVDQMRTLVVTSASPGEGKTVTAANLAVSFAQQGVRVLLVDGDLRRGRLHRVFGTAREPGLSDYLLGYQTEEAVSHSTAVPNLYVIDTGKLPPNPAEILGADVAKEKFAKLTEGYDLVIIDTPPLLAASDAAIVATLADGVVIVLRAGSTETAAAQQAMQQLRALDVRIVGAILNDPDSQIAKYGAYYQYSYDYAGNKES